MRRRLAQRKAPQGFATGTCGSSATLRRAPPGPGSAKARGVAAPGLVVRRAARGAQRYAAIPVTASPSTSVWMLCVPS